MHADSYEAPSDIPEVTLHLGISHLDAESNTSDWCGQMPRCSQVRVCDLASKAVVMKSSTIR